MLPACGEVAKPDCAMKYVDFLSKSGEKMSLGNKKHLLQGKLSRVELPVKNDSFSSRCASLEHAVSLLNCFTMFVLLSAFL